MTDNSIYSSYAGKPITAIIPAAGIGSRMQNTVPKQYLRINQHAMLEITIKRLLSVKHIDTLIVALHPDDRRFEQLDIASHAKIKTVLGGDSRAESVINALRLCHSSHWALVHDAARPCVKQTDIENLIKRCAALASGGAILATQVVDTIKQSSLNQPCQVAHTVDRRVLWHALTPQMFNVKELLIAYQSAIAKGHTLTDEASAIEYSGLPVHLIASSKENIKVTHSEDMALASFYLNKELNS